MGRSILWVVSWCNLLCFVAHLPALQGVPPSMLPAGTILRFAVSRPGSVAGLPACRLPPGTSGSNLYAYMVVS